MLLTPVCLDANAYSSHLVFGRQLLAAMSLVLLAACSDSDTPPVTDSGEMAVPEVGSTTDPDTTITPDQTATQARYRLTLNASWSAETHPLNFPSNPHFSGLVGAVHNEQVRFWEPAQIATPGIQLMAETGGKSTLLNEVQLAIDAGSALGGINGGGVARSPGSTSVEFDVNRDYPQITVTSMLAPSPDWFVGLHNYSLINDGVFIDNATIDLVLYDSGSDSGLRYNAANDASDPLMPIARVSTEPQDSPFVDGLPIVGTFVLERITSTEP